MPVINCLCSAQTLERQQFWGFAATMQAHLLAARPTPYLLEVSPSIAEFLAAKDAEGVEEGLALGRRQHFHVAALPHENDVLAALFLREDQLDAVGLLQPPFELLDHVSLVPKECEPDAKRTTPSSVVGHRWKQSLECSCGGLLYQNAVEAAPVVGHLTCSRAR